MTAPSRSKDSVSPSRSLGSDLDLDLVYGAGGQALLVGGRVILMSPSVDWAMSYWNALEAGADGATVMDQIVRSGLSGLPDFVLLQFDPPRLRLVVRGDLMIDVQRTDGVVERCSAEGVTTWVERVVDDVVQARMGGAPSTLPLRAGVALAGCWELRPISVSSLRLPPQRPATPSSLPASPRDAASPAGRTPADVAATRVPVTTVGHSELVTESEPPTHETRTEFEDGSGVPRSSGQAAAEPGGNDTSLSASFRHLFGQTMQRDPEHAAVRDGDGEHLASTPVNGGVVVDPVRGDHDGFTIASDHLRSLLGDEVRPPVGAHGRVEAVLSLSSGEMVSLERGVVLGRRPQVDRVSGEELPHLVTVPSPNRDISRSHLRIDRTADGYRATDLHSLNGTLLHSASGTVAALPPGQPHPVTVGDLLDLGEGFTVVLREKP